MKKIKQKIRQKEINQQEVISLIVQKFLKENKGRKSKLNKKIYENKRRNIKDEKRRIIEL